MRTIELDASKWQSVDDALRAIKLAIQAPDWHGDGIDAFLDTMIYHDDINGLKSPYTLVVKRLSQASSDAREFTKRLAAAVDEEAVHDRSTDLEVAVVLD